MGNKSSATQFEGFDKSEIARLSKRFKKLDTDRSGAVSVAEFLNVPELKQNPLMRRVIEVLDMDCSGEVDFKEFVLGLAEITCDPSADWERKLKFAFRVYDLDGDGLIDLEELFQIMKTMVGNNLKEEQLRQVVNRTVLFVDKDCDTKISYEEFKDLVTQRSIRTKIAEKLTIDKSQI